MGSGVQEEGWGRISKAGSKAGVRHRVGLADMQMGRAGRQQAGSYTFWLQPQIRRADQAS